MWRMSQGSPDCGEFRECTTPPATYFPVELENGEAFEHEHLQCRHRVVGNWRFSPSGGILNALDAFSHESDLP